VAQGAFERDPGPIHSISAETGPNKGPNGEVFLRNGGGRADAAYSVNSRAVEDWIPRNTAGRRAAAIENLRGGGNCAVQNRPLSPRITDFFCGQFLRTPVEQAKKTRRHGREVSFHAEGGPGLGAFFRFTSGSGRRLSAHSKPQAAPAVGSFSKPYPSRNVVGGKTKSAGGPERKNFRFGCSSGNFATSTGIWKSESTTKRGGRLGGTALRGTPAFTSDLTLAQGANSTQSVKKGTVCRVQPRGLPALADPHRINVRVGEPWDFRPTRPASGCALRGTYNKGI